MILGNCINCKKEFRKREHKYTFCSRICANRFNKNGLKKVVLPKKSSLLAEFIGICLGDGYSGKYYISITLNSIADKDYITYVADLARLLFPQVNVSFIQKRDANAVDVRINSVTIATFFRNMGLIPNNKTVPKWINSKIIYQKACVRGLIDTEGSVSKKVYFARKGKSIYFQLNFRNYDIELMRFVRDVLVNLGMKPTLNLSKSLYLSNPKSISIYKKEVGFGNPKLANAIT